jgi:hypothetical protein
LKKGRKVRQAECDPTRPECCAGGGFSQSTAISTAGRSEVGDRLRQWRGSLRPDAHRSRVLHARGDLSHRRASAAHFQFADAFRRLGMVTKARSSFPEQQTHSSSSFSSFSNTFLPSQLGFCAIVANPICTPQVTFGIENPMNSLARQAFCEGPILTFPLMLAPEVEAARSKALAVPSSVKLFAADN